MKPATLIGMLILFFIGIGHLLRLVFQVELIIGNISIPMWVSAIGFPIPVILAIAIWRENRSRENEK